MHNITVNVWYSKYTREGAVKKSSAYSGDRLSPSSVNGKDRFSPSSVNGKDRFSPSSGHSGDKDHRRRSATGIRTTVVGVQRKGESHTPNSIAAVDLYSSKKKKKVLGTALLATHSPYKHAFCRQANASQGDECIRAMHGRCSHH